ncbi:MAG TPA: hypothetical protein VGJ83_07605 [Gemmatimonadales bacterium]|jgi:hypothetical protein
MRRPVQAVIVQGVIGGILAGMVVALWFLVADVLAGHAFRTPALLAGVLLHRDFPQPTLPLVSAYTVLHFGVFALLGVVMAWVSAAFAAPPRLLLGVVFGLVLQEVVFYTALIMSHAPRLDIVPWPHVFGANIASGLVLMGYLHRAERDPRPMGLAALRDNPALMRGLVTGLIGAAVVAAWFFVLDLAAGVPLATPAALGAALLFGAAGPAEVVISFGLVATYTVVHVAAFALAGILLVAVAEQVERTPAMVLVVALACIVLEALVFAALAVEAEWVLGTLGWWSLAVANLLAVVAMGWQVWRTHPTLRDRLLHDPVHVRV